MWENTNKWNTFLWVNTLPNKDYIRCGTNSITCIWTYFNAVLYFEDYRRNSGFVVTGLTGTRVWLEETSTPNSCELHWEFQKNCNAEGVYLDSQDIINDASNLTNFKGWFMWVKILKSCYIICPETLRLTSVDYFELFKKTI